MNRASRSPFHPCVPGLVTRPRSGRSARAGLTTLVLAASTLLLGACASSRISYGPPATSSPLVVRAVSLERPSTQVWETAIRELSRPPFRIDRADPRTGLIVAIYRGDPRRYVDCGRVEVEVTSPWGASRRHAFAGASAQQPYEREVGTALPIVERAMDMEAQVTIVVQPTTADHTRASAFARYALMQILTRRDASGELEPPESTRVVFTTGEYARFAELGPEGLLCAPTGTLEAEALGALAVRPRP